MIGDFIYLTISSALVYNAISSILYMRKCSLFKEVAYSMFKFCAYIFMYSTSLRMSYMLTGQYSFIGDMSANMFAILSIFTCLFSVISYVSYIVTLDNKYIFSYSILYSLMPVMFLLLCSTLLCYLHQHCNIMMFFIIFMFLSVFKISGNFTTKVGDIIADYDEKIIKKQSEDKSNSVFSFIDNIGDIIGDLFGTFVDYISLFMLCMILMYITNSFTLFNYLFFLNNIIGKLIIYSIIMSILVYFKGSKAFFKYTDYVLIISVFISHLFYVLKILYSLGLGYKAIGSVFYLDMMNLTFFSVASLSISLLTSLRLYDRFACCFVKMVSIMPIVSISILCSMGYVFAYMFINYVHCVSKFIFWFFKTDINSLSFLNHFIFFGLYYVFKTVFGALVDSSCGFFKKKINEQTKSVQKRSDDSEQNKSKKQIKNEEIINSIENTLEHYDATGNMFKFETKLFFMYIGYVLYEIVSQNTYKILLVQDFMSMIPFLVVIVFMSLCYRMYSNINTYSFNDIINLTVKYAFATFYILSNLLFTIVFVKSSVSISYMRVLHSGLMYLFLIQSIVFYFIGTMFDVIKKKVENNEITVNEDIYSLLLQLDLIGDCFKDVIGPFMFSISNFVCFILIFIK